MTKKAIRAAVTEAWNKGEEFQLSQAIEWMKSYNLIEYKEYTYFSDEWCNEYHKRQDSKESA